ncbi:MAG: UPF0057 membrane protein YqaE, partial [uncultured Rubrobacteraceae bacterium]
GFLPDHSIDHNPATRGVLAGRFHRAVLDQRPANYPGLPAGADPRDIHNPHEAL